MYDDENVYWYSEPEGAFFAAPGAEMDGGSGRVMRPINRDSTGNLRASVRDGNWLERALGSKGRSGGQYVSTVGSNGCPSHGSVNTLTQPLLSTGHLAGGLLSAGQRRLPCSDLRQADGRD